MVDLVDEQAECSGGPCNDNNVKAAASELSAARRHVGSRVTPCRNPFYEQERNNFPDFEIALKMGTENLEGGTFDDDDHEQRSLVNQSACSTVGTSSVLNMSIGARAALNEHMRHVAKYGIDGEKPHGSCERKVDDTAVMQEVASNNEQIHDLDDHWENLLDVSSSKLNFSGEGGSFAGTPPAADQTSTFQNESPNHNVLFATSTEFDGDGIEVMTDVSHDYFNSSRVKLLITPERNQNRRMDMVVTRDDFEIEDGPFAEESFVHEEPSSFDMSRHDFSGVAVNPTLPPCFLSIQQGDENINNLTANSLISPGDLSDVRKSPDTSFLSKEHHLELDVSAISPMIEWDGPSPLQSRDIPSHLSAPVERVARESWSSNQRNDFPKTNPRTLSATFGSQRQFRQPLDSKVAPVQQKENFSPDPSSSNSRSKDTTHSSLQSAVSSLLNEAKSMVAYVATELEQSFRGLESFPADFLRAMDLSGGGCNADPPSPISNEQSTNSSSQDSGKRKENQRLDVKRDRIIMSGRKRFRTVVPRNIYYGSNNSVLEEDQESFLAVQSNPETVMYREPMPVDATAVRTTF